MIIIEEEITGDRGIEDLLAGNHKVRITGYAFDKINAYAQAVSGMIGHPSEVMGFLTGEADDMSCTATDACLVCEQHVEDWRAFPEGNAFARTYAAVKKSGRKIVGMWHSHGSIDNFHSRDDDSYLTDVLINNTYYLENIIEAEGIRTHYASSVVINQESYLRPRPSDNPVKDEHYFCCVGVRDGQDEKVLVKDLALDIVEDRADENTEKDIDLQDICQDICASVKHGGRFLIPVETEDKKGQAMENGNIGRSGGIWRRIINYFSRKDRGKMNEQQA